MLLEYISSFKDLEIIFDNDLSQTNQVTNIVSKFNEANGMIRRWLGYNAPISVSMKLYKTFVRSIAEYATPVWYPKKRMQLQCALSFTLSWFIIYITKNAARYLTLSARATVCICQDLTSVDVRRQILTYKDDHRTEKIEIFILAVDTYVSKWSGKS